eukprot:1195998-Prorocentrum_minimum.AAC.7
MVHQGSDRSVLLGGGSGWGSRGYPTRDPGCSGGEAAGIPPGTPAAQCVARWGLRVGKPRGGEAAGIPPGTPAAQCVASWGLRVGKPRVSHQGPRLLSVKTLADHPPSSGRVFFVEGWKGNLLTSEQGLVRYPLLGFCWHGHLSKV